MATISGASIIPTLDNSPSLKKIYLVFIKRHISLSAYQTESMISVTTIVPLRRMYLSAYSL